MDVTFRIRRRNPDMPGKEKPYWQEFALADVEPTDRVLEMLHRIKWEQDGTLSAAAFVRARGFAAPTPCASTASIGWLARS